MAEFSMWYYVTWLISPPRRNAVDPRADAG
jgi:hypothetical protein